MIEKLINNEDNSTHVPNQTASLNLALEYPVEALMDAVQDHAKDEFIVISHAHDEDGHVRVRAENCHVVLHQHDIILKRVDTSAAPSRTLLA